MNKVLWNLIEGEHILKNHQGICLWAIFTTSSVFSSLYSEKKLWNCSSHAFDDNTYLEPLNAQEAIIESIDWDSFPLDVTAHPKETNAYISLYLSLKSSIFEGYTD